MVRVVVTGAAGFLGRFVVQALKGQGLDVVALSRRPYAGFHQVADYSQAPPGDVLIHLAQESDRSRAEHHGDAGMHEAVTTMRFLVAKPYARVIYASSALLYGDQDNEPRRATDPVRLGSTYAQLKFACEQVVLDTGRGVVARIANLYGPGMAPANVVSTILRQIPGTGPVKIMDDTPIRDFLWVEDAGQAISVMAVGTKRGVFNVGTGMGTQIGSLVRMALDIVAQDRPIVVARPSARASSLVLDVADTEVVWNWRFRTTVTVGLKKLLEKGPAWQSAP